MSDDPTTKTADEIRDDIEQTRADLGDTVEALGAKSDVKGRAQAKVEDLKDTAHAKVEDVKAKATPSGNGDGVPAAAQAKAQQAVGAARENPLPVGIVLALVVGYLIGRRTAR
jgi:ElaB/YqjD/DUF883 family membrane-anchored ribosome-binding protein